MQWFTNPKKSDLGWLRYHSPYLAHQFLVMSPSVRLAPFWRGRFQHCLTQFPPHTRRHIHLSHGEKKDVKGCQRIHWKWNCSFSAPLKLETSELAGNGSNGQACWFLNACHDSIVLPTWIPATSFRQLVKGKNDKGNHANLTTKFR